MTVLPDCPRCGDNRLVFEEDDRGLWCNYCKIAFDNDPDEGGDHFTDPTKRIEVREARATKGRANLPGDSYRHTQPFRKGRRKHKRRG